MCVEALAPVAKLPPERGIPFLLCHFMSQSLQPFQNVILRGTTEDGMEKQTELWGTGSVTWRESESGTRMKSASQHVLFDLFLE